MVTIAIKVKKSLTCTYHKHQRGALSEGGNASGKTDHENDGAHHQADVTGGVVPANGHVVRVHPQGTVAANPNGDAEDAHSEGLGKKEKTQLIS